MKKIVLLAAIVSTLSYAHEPYVAPLAYVTENTQVPVLAGYAENAFNSEYALKDATFNIIDPKQVITTIKPTTTLKSTTAFDLALPTDGTYRISSQVTYPLKYALHNKQWKLFYDASAEEAGEFAKRDYLIPDDFKKSKKPEFAEVTRKWTIESYVTKNKSTAITQKVDAPLNVSFSVHPNEIVVDQPLNIQVTKAGQHLKNAEINVLAQGNNESQRIKTRTNDQGIVEFKFPTSGQYLVEVTESIDSKLKPKDQDYSIVSLSIQAKSE